MILEATPVVEKHLRQFPSPFGSTKQPGAGIIPLNSGGVLDPGSAKSPLSAIEPNVHAATSPRPGQGQVDSWPLKGVKRFVNGRPKTPPAMDPQSPALLTAEASSRHAGGIPAQTSPARVSEARQTEDEKTASLVAAMGDREPGAQFTDAEDRLLVHLKEAVKLTWPEIHTYFPHRATWQTLQSRYSNKLNKNRRPRMKRPQSPQSDSDSDADPAMNAAGFDVDSGRSYRLRAERKVKYFPPVLEVSGFESLLAAKLPPVKEMFATRSNIPARQTTKIVQANRSPKHLSQKIAALERSRDDAAIASMMQKVTCASRNDSLFDALRSNGFSMKGTHRKSPSRMIQRPYLGAHERSFLHRSVAEHAWDQELASSWDSQLLHADFTHDEIGILKKTMRAVTSKHIHEVSDNEIREIASKAISSGPFLNRTISSIESFLQDASSAQVNRQRRIIRIGERRNGSSTNRILRRREQGLEEHSFSGSRLKYRMETTFGPSRRFQVMSNDVNTIAWSPDSLSFAVGATAVTDENSMQYNKPYNLLVGNQASGRLRELPQHTIPRLAEAGINATEGMRNTQDPYLFTTISAVDYSADGKLMFSAGFDDCVRMWQVGQDTSDVHCRYRVPCGSKVDHLAVGPSGLFAVGTQTAKKAVKLYHYDWEDDHLEHCRKGTRFSSQSASQWPTLAIQPSCLRWGPGLHSARYLLGGFASADDVEKRGETCLWDVESEQEFGISVNKRSVFDVTWYPPIPGRFAVGCSASGNVNRGTKSVVQIYDFRSLPATAGSSAAGITRKNYTVELECPALDMNDVLMNPCDSYLVSTGCTDGCVYLWDLRRPDQLLHTFEHGMPLSELDHQRSREEADTGVRFMSWNSDGRYLFTGSSDGVVSLWDPYVNSEDAHSHSITQMNSGIMAGRFSPDFSNLLVGDVQGSLVMLSVGQEAAELDEASPFEFQTATPSEISGVAESIPKEDSGIAISRDLVSAGKMEIRPYGDFPKKQAVQGTNYDGPYDGAADSHSLRQAAAQSQARATAANLSQTALNDPAVAFMQQDVCDEKHWTARIPETLRLDKARSSHSATQARFRCFRCRSEDVQLGPSTENTEDLLECPACGAAWQADVLGYELLRHGDAQARARESPAPPRGQLEPLETLDCYLDA